jgi:hypothetical protein
MADHAGAVPRGHTVYADGRVVRWNGRSAASGGVPIGTTTASARERLWEAVERLDDARSEPVMGATVFLDLETDTGIRRIARPADAQLEDPFAQAFEVCQAAAGEAA